MTTGKFHEKGMGMAKRTHAQQISPVESRKDSAGVVGALNDALETEKNRAAAFLAALRQVADTYGIAPLAAEAKLSRESLYRTLSENGNPRLSTIMAVLDVLELQLKVEQRTKAEQPQPVSTPPQDTLPLPSLRLTPTPPPKKHSMKVELWLMVERNSKFVRGKKGAREDIESYVLRRYNMKKRWPDGNEYELTIPYDTDEELDNIIYRDIIQAASFQADMRNCFIETDVRALDGSERSW
jgi:probable addiction module antidote protein